MVVSNGNAAGANNMLAGVDRVAAAGSYQRLVAEGGSNPAALLGSLLADVTSLARTVNRGSPAPASPPPHQQHVAITLPSQLATDDAADTAAGQSPTTTARYEVTGMSCGSCVAALESGLTRVPGVRAATASLLTSSLVVQYDASVVNAESLAETVEDLGYTATLLRVESGGQDGLQAAGVGGICTLQLVVSGMSCGSCVAAIETAVAAVRSHHLIA